MEDLFVATFETEETDALWRYVNHIIHMAASAGGIVIGIDNILCSIEEFCASQGITEIKPLHRALLEEAGFGENMSAKYIYYHRAAWVHRFPNGVVYSAPANNMDNLQAYKRYLEAHDLKYELHFLEFYLKSL